MTIRLNFHSRIGLLVRPPPPPHHRVVKFLLMLKQRKAWIDLENSLLFAIFFYLLSCNSPGIKSIATLFLSLLVPEIWSPIIQSVP
jgi:hypothetical protein